MKRNRVVLLFLSIAVIATTAWAMWRPAGIGSSNAGESPSAAQGSTQGPGTATSSSTSSAPGNAGAFPVQRTAGAPATAQFEQSRRCYFAQGEADARKSVARACQSLPRDGTAQAQVDSCKANVEADQDAAAQTDPQAGTECRGEIASARHFYEATKAAAASGNADAQACYVQSRFQSNGADLTYSPQDVSDYKRDAPRYISDGLARGDWRIVSLLARGGHDDHFSPLSLVTKDDVYMQYVMNRLLQMGAEGAYAQQQERFVQAIFLSPRISGPPALTPEQVSAGTQEAQALFRKAFDKQPLLKAAPIACRGA